MLILYYEDMKTDLLSSLRSIAHHLELGMTDDQLEEKILPKVRRGGVGWIVVDWVGAGGGTGHG